MNKIDATASDNRSASLPNPSGVVIMTGVAKKTVELKRKGELIEQNQDGLEVSLFSFVINVDHYHGIMLMLSSPSFVTLKTT